ncbi:MAG: GNAT family N-acetyltransferase [Deltaproteobacteria bacterium]|nr:GNAT family N-acetyltransferase [Deltaproteobacteria bacterium]
MVSAMSDSKRSRTTLRRHPERARPEDLHAVLDEAMIVHVGVATERGPLVLPMAFGRIGERLYLHGAVANGLLKALGQGDACVVATHLDGLVLAKSTFRHSMNYRSAVAFGPLHAVDDPAEIAAALDAITDHALPGRSAEARSPNPSESRATRVMAMDLTEASVKVRTGPPSTNEDDALVPAWTGVLPLALRAGPPETIDAVRSPALRAAILARAPRLGGSFQVGEYTIDTDPTRLDLDRVLRWIRDESYWGQSLTEERLLRSLHAAFLVGVYDAKGTQVAIARVVTDEVTLAWLGDVFVDEAHRHRGLGRAMVRFVVEHPRFADVRKWLLGTADAHELYRSLGFEDAPAGRYMIRPRSDNPVATRPIVSRA